MGADSLFFLEVLFPTSAPDLKFQAATAEWVAEMASTAADTSAWHTRALTLGMATDTVHIETALTELSRRDAELSRLSAALAERNRELGELSARVAEAAHGLNNPLAALASCLRMHEKLSSSELDGAPQGRSLALLRRSGDACDRMTAVVEQLRLSCRGGALPERAERVEMAQEIDGALALLAHRVPAGVSVVREVSASAVAIGSADEVHHTVVNLVTNALQALASKGVREGTVRIECQAEDGWVRLSVSDSGPGIDAAIAPRIFEPFFTTAQPGQGTGLGLSMVRRMACRFGGSVSVEPKGALGGATVHVILRAS